MKGSLYGFDGVDRTGKSSTMRFLEQELTKLGREVVAVESKTILGVRVPTLIGNFPDEITYMLFWQAIRLQEITVILPALDAGKIVLCDRGPFSQFAYDWWEGLDPTFKSKQDEIYLEYCVKPKTTYLFTMPYDAFVKRDDGQTKLSEELYDKIQSSYMKWGLSLRGQMDIVFVDSSKTLDEVQSFVLDCVLSTVGEV